MSSRARPLTVPVEPREQRADLEAGHVRHHVLDVAADVAHAVRHAGLPRVRAPGGLLLPRSLERRGEPLLRVLGGDEADVAQLAARDHLAHVPHHRVAGVRIGDGEQQPLPLRQGAERPRVRRGTSPAASRTSRGCRARGRAWRRGSGAGWEWRLRGSRSRPRAWPPPRSSPGDSDRGARAAGPATCRSRACCRSRWRSSPPSGWPGRPSRWPAGERPR